MSNDMTTGKPVRLILGFMIPVCLGNIFQQLYNVADSVIAGKYLGVNALAAIGSTSSLIFLVIGWLNGLTSGFAILVAQNFGAKRYDQMRHYLAMSVYLCLAFVLVMTVGLIAGNYGILHLMKVPDVLIADVGGYMEVIYAGLFVTAAYNAFSAVLRSIGDSISPLIFLIVSAVINVFLDIAFILWFGMGVVGCGYATVIAQGISVLLCLIYIMKKYELLKLKKKDFFFSIQSIGQLLALGIPMGLQFSITAIGTIIVQGAINSLGPVYIAGYSAAQKIQSIVVTVFVSFGATIATYVGQNRGAGKMERVYEGVKVTQIMILLWSAVIFVFVTLFGGSLTSLFIDQSKTAVLEASAVYFKTVAWCYPFLGSIFLYRNALQGMGYGLVPMLGGVFELLARAVVVAVIVAPLGYLGVCMADPAAWLAALIPLVPYYFIKMKKSGSNFKENRL